MRLQGKRIVVSGGSRGLGKALVHRFAREGAQLAICARHGDALDAIVKDLRETGMTVIARRCDIANMKEVEEFASLVLTEFDSIDVLVNNASAIVPLKKLVDYTQQEWEAVMQTNINGLFNFTHAFLHSMMKSKGGTIINVSSSVGRAMRAQWGAYAVSKYALEGFTQLLAEELRPFNISVNSVNPGAMATAMRHVVYPEEDQKLLRKPELVTDLFVYLASNDGEGISGQQFDASTYVAHPKDKE